MPLNTDTFYRDLDAFDQFSGVGDVGQYRPVPDDWVILAADIVSSRQAIADGHYKEVNMVGAAVIAAVLNVIGRDTVPFVFGGDGAMLLVPGSDVQAGRLALAGVAKISREEAGLDLRCAAIPVAHIRSQGLDIRIRKYRLSPENHLAMIIGGGLEKAELILKDDGLCAPFRIEDLNASRPNLDGLSCRWEPLQSEKGRIVSLILKPSTVNGDDFSLICDRIGKIAGYDLLGETEAANHVTRSRLRLRFPPRKTLFEARMLAAAGRRFVQTASIILQSLAVVWAVTTGLRVGPFRPHRYLQELCRNTDHRKLDDSLRFVLDVTFDQLEAIKSYLEDAAVSGQLMYGLHESDSALMTCFVTDLDASQHVHFIDGANGGFALAAQDMKQRQAASA